MGWHNIFGEITLGLNFDGHSCHIRNEVYVIEFANFPGKVLLCHFVQGEIYDSITRCVENPVGCVTKSETFFFRSPFSEERDEIISMGLEYPKKFLNQGYFGAF